jgi:hypothetical protein
MNTADPSTPGSFRFWLFPWAVWILSVSILAGLVRPRHTGPRWWVYPLALFSWPLLFLGALPYASRKTLFLDDDRRTILILDRNPSWRLTLGGALGVAVTLVGGWVLGGIYILLLCLYLFAVSALLLAATSVDSVVADFELLFAPPRETYWTVNYLGSLAGKTPDARRFATRVVRDLVRAGDLIAVVADNQQDAKAYEEYGFVRKNVEGLLLSARR